MIIMFKNMFMKKVEFSKAIELKAYATGSIMKLEDIPDPVFCRKNDG